MTQDQFDIINRRLDQLLAGQAQYGYATQLKGVGLRCPLMLLLRDDSRLRAVRSPLLRILMRSGREDKAIVTRVRLEPVVDPFQA